MQYNAATNSLLAVIKRIFNAKIYQIARRTYNAEGKDATLTFIGQYVNAESRPRFLAQLEADALAESQRRSHDRSIRFRKF